MSRKSKNGKPAVGLRKPARPSPEDVEAFINGGADDEKAGGESNVVSLRQADASDTKASESKAADKSESEPRQRARTNPSNDVGVAERVDRKRRRMTVYFDDFELVDALKVKAVTENREMSEIVEAAVSAYLK